MDEISPLAVFLKKNREAKGLNPREFADAIKAVGGQATTQAVQQWENTTPAQRTTRPNITNRHAIAKVLDCDLNEFESAYRAARDLARTSAENEPLTPIRIPAKSRVAISSRFESEITDAIRAQIPDSGNYLEKVITPLGMRQCYDYLSPKLAVEWIVATNYSPRASAIENHLWKLLWLSRLDSDTGVARKYLIILVLVGDDPLEMLEIEAYFDRFRQEARVFGNTLTLCLASSPAEAADLVVAHELGLEAPANTTPAEAA